MFITESFSLYSSNTYIRSPLNYIGGKYKLLNQILPLFPNYINNFVDLFAGGLNIGINVHANKYYFNDNLVYLINLYEYFYRTNLPTLVKNILSTINKFELSLTNSVGYNNLRSAYNQNRDPLLLFLLISFSFNHQIRFNSNHRFNTPFGKNKSCFNKSIEQNLVAFINRLKNLNIIFSSNNFDHFDFTTFSPDDFVYCDPPYLITSGSYNDGRRGFTGWGLKEELNLYSLLDTLNKNNIKFALSNVINHKDKVNNYLITWLENNPNYFVNQISSSYKNSNYQLKKTSSITNEVLITNYKVRTF